MKKNHAIQILLSVERNTNSVRENKDERKCRPNVEWSVKQSKHIIVNFHSWTETEKREKERTKGRVEWRVPEHRRLKRRKYSRYNKTSSSRSYKEKNEERKERRNEERKERRKRRRKKRMSGRVVHYPSHLLRERVRESDSFFFR